MSTASNDKAAVEDRLWREIKDLHGTGMLGLSHSDQHFQPMTAFGEPETGQIWFFARKESDLARAVAQPAKAMFVIQAKDQDFQACVGGDLVQAHDPARIDKYWNPVVAAWYPEGKDDPNLTLLRLDARDAAIWIVKGGVARFAWQIGKANATGQTPDLGDSVRITL
jgi:general stress protein 26